MKHLAFFLPTVVLGLSPLVAAAGPHGGGEHGRGHGHGHGHGYTQAYWDGPCKVERKFRPNGGYKEERKCRGAAYAVAAPMAVVLPAPVIVAAPVMVEPGIVIQGTVRIR